MSQDPNQPPSDYGSTQNPYGTPPPQEYYGTPPPQGPYNVPSQGPYGVPPTGVPPQGQYGVPPQGPYGAPPQGQYGAPPQGPYGAPPQGPYGVPPQGFYGPPPGYGYGVPPSSSPLPLGEAISQLPSQYIKVLTKPSAATFAEEMGKASWDIIWIQLVIYAVISAVLGYAANALVFNSFNTTGVTPLNPDVAQLINAVQLIALSRSIGSIIVVPISFFIVVGILYLVAKAFGGTGTFHTQSYTTLLISVPLGIISGILSLVPILGALAAIALVIYQIILNIFSIMAVHRLSGGKATAVVLIPIGVVILLFVCLFVFIFVIAAASLSRP